MLFRSVAYKNAVRQAIAFVREDVIAAIEQSLPKSDENALAE